MISRKSLTISTAIVALTVGAYAAAGFWWLPRLVRSNFQSFVSQQLRLQPTIGEVRFNPFTLKLQVATFSVRAADSTPLIACGGLAVDLSVSSLWRRALIFNTIELTQPSVNAVVGADRRLNLSALLPAPAADADKSRKHPAESAPAVGIGLLRISNGEASFTDNGRDLPMHVTLRPVTISLRNFSTLAGSGNDYHIAATAADGGQLAWTGRLALQPFAAQGKFAVSKVALQTIAAAIRDGLPFKVVSGSLNLAGSYALSAATTPMSAHLDIASLDVADLALRASAHARNDLSLAHLAVRAASVDVRDRALRLGNIDVSGMKLWAWLDDNGLSLQARTRWPDAANGAARASAPAAPSATGSAWKVLLPKLSFTDADVHLEDRRGKQPVVLSVARLNASATGYSNAPAAVVTLDSNLRFNGNGRLSIAGTVVPDSLASRLQVKLSDLAIKDFSPYFTDLVRLDVQGGLIDAAGELRRDAGGGGTLQFRGTAAIRSLALRDRLMKRDFLRWRTLHLQGIDFVSRPATLRVAKIDVDSPYIDLVINEKRTTNLADVFKAPTTSNEATARTDVARTATGAPIDSSGLRVELPLLRITHGSANFADLSVQPQFATGIQNLTGEIKGMSTRPGTRAVVQLDGEVDKYSPVKIDGDINFLAAEAYSDLHASFQNIELTTFNPYSTKFAGYRIAMGKLSVDTEYKIVNRKLDATHKILVNQLQLGERIESKDAVHLPLKIAVALLKDRDGNIRLDLPISGNIDDPKFRVGPIIWKMFVNLLVKIAASPFTLLGHLFGGSDDIKFVDFAAGSAALAPAMTERLANVRKALVSRPGLALEIPLVSDPALDGKALQDARYQQQLATLPDRTDARAYIKALSALVDSSDGATATGIEKQLREQSKAAGKKLSRDELQTEFIIQLEAAVRAANRVTPADLAALAQGRARAVQDTLLASKEIDAGRVFITVAKPAAAVDGHVRLELTLKT